MDHDRIRAERRERLARGASALLESGIPQQLIQVVQNLGLSVVQAGAGGNPWMSLIAGTLVIETAGKVGILSNTAQNALEAAGGLWMAAEILRKGLPTTISWSEANSVAFDIPDVQPVRRERLPLPPSRILAGIPRAAAQRAPAPAPIEEPIEEPITEPLPPPLPGAGFTDEPIQVPGSGIGVPVAQPAPIRVARPTRAPVATRAPIAAVQPAPLPVVAGREEPVQVPGSGIGTPVQIAAAGAAVGTGIGIAGRATARPIGAGGGVQRRIGPGLEIG